MISDIDVIVERCGGVKCDRCWKYHGIPDNAYGMCDFCCRTILESSVEDFPQLTAEEVTRLQEYIKNAYLNQKQRWHSLKT